MPDERRQPRQNDNDWVCLMLPHRREALSPVNLDTDTQKTGQGSLQHTPASIGFSEIRSRFCIFHPCKTRCFPSSINTKPYSLQLHAPLHDRSQGSPSRHRPQYALPHEFRPRIPRRHKVRESADRSSHPALPYARRLPRLPCNGEPWATFPKRSTALLRSASPPYQSGARTSHPFSLPDRRCTPA